MATRIPRNAAGNPSVDYVDVNAAVNGGIDSFGQSWRDGSGNPVKAQDGDTVQLGSGTATWQSALNITKKIILQGNTTITQPDRPADLIIGTNPALHQIVTDVTIIIGASTVANIINATLNTVPNPLDDFSNNPPLRITGITFQGPPNLHFTGATQNYAIRIDHCHISNTGNGNAAGGNGKLVMDTGMGVIDHCRIDGLGETTYGKQTKWSHDGATHDFSDGSWADYPYYGTGKFWIFEDNILYKPVNGQGTTPDYVHGARIVFRYNSFYNTGIAGHGTENDKLRGHRAVEVYNNDFIWEAGATNGSIQVNEFRSGSGLIHNNKWKIASTSFLSLSGLGMRLTNYRSRGPCPFWNGQNGINKIDKIDVSDRSTSGVPGAGTNGKYASGTPANGGTAITGSGVGFLKVAANQWTAGMWAGNQGYVLVKTSPVYAGVGTCVCPSPSCDQNTQQGIAAGLGRYLMASIVSNTTNTITVQSGDNTNMKEFFIDAGDSWEIHRVILGLDQPGAGRCDLLVRGTLNKFGCGLDPAQAAFVTPFDPGPPVGGISMGLNQVIEPVMWWGSTAELLTGAPIADPYLHITDTSGGMVDGVHYKDLGSGVTSAAPAAVQAAYPAGVNCPTGDTANAYDGTYVYPHPLVETTPTIISAASASWTTGGGTQTHQIQVANFSGAITSYAVADDPAVAGTSWPITNVSFTTGAGGGKLTYTGTGSIGTYNLILTARNDVPAIDEVATQPFTLDIASGVTNQPPTSCSITAPAPPNLTFLTTDTVTITATAADAEGPIAKIEILDSVNGATATVIDTSGANPTLPYSVGKIFSVAGTHALKARATDQGTLTLDSATITLSISTPPTSLPAPTIVVSG